MAGDKFRMTHHKRTTEIDFIAGVFLMMKLIFSKETPVSNYFAWFWKSKKVVFSLVWEEGWLHFWTRAPCLQTLVLFMVRSLGIMWSDPQNSFQTGC